MIRIDSLADISFLSLPSGLCDGACRLETIWDNRIQQERHRTGPPFGGIKTSSRVQHRFANSAATFAHQRRGARTLIIRRARASDFWQTFVPPCAPGTESWQTATYAGGARTDHQSSYQGRAEVPQDAPLGQVDQRCSQSSGYPSEVRLQHGRGARLPRLHQTDPGNVNRPFRRTTPLPRGSSISAIMV